MIKDIALVTLFIHLRNHILQLAPESHELIYNTHALTSVFSHTKKLSHAFCHIPIYSNHLNLGFNKGTLLSDPDNLLQGTGKLIRHIPMKEIHDFENDYVTKLIQESMALVLPD
ncbi:MAG: DUF1801 domain-containing protein [Cytophagales bacterium]|nr:DUF1801 domain-containing protein [Cytophagales bacterium]